MSLPLPVPAAVPVPLKVPLVVPGAVVPVVPPEAARGMGVRGAAPQEWALVQRTDRRREDFLQRRSASSNAIPVPSSNGSNGRSNSHSTATASPTVILRHFASTESISG